MQDESVEELAKRPAKGPCTPEDPQHVNSMPEVYEILEDVRKHR
jgi:hypothetical protein